MELDIIKAALLFLIDLLDFCVEFLMIPFLGGCCYLRPSPIVELECKAVLLAFLSLRLLAETAREGAKLISF